jgi:hypothetical protein
MEVDDFDAIQGLDPWVRSSEDTIGRIVNQSYRRTGYDVIHVDAPGLRAIAINKDKVESRDDIVDAPSRFDGHLLRRDVVPTLGGCKREESVSWRVCFPLAKADRRIRERAADGLVLRGSRYGSKHAADTGDFQGVPSTSVRHRTSPEIVRFPDNRF